jgi:hypothetical protein
VHYWGLVLQACGRVYFSSAAVWGS